MWSRGSRRSTRAYGRCARSWASRRRSEPCSWSNWAPAENEGDKILFLFDGSILDAEQLAAIQLEPGELRGHAFHHLADADALLIRRLARRNAAALDARRDGVPRYLEHGTTRSAALPS